MIRGKDRATPVMCHFQVQWPPLPDDHRSRENFEEPPFFILLFDVPFHIG